MAKPVDWIARLIEQELDAVVAWRRNSRKAHHTIDGDPRFEDDGSNLRSIVRGSGLPSEPLVQISEVISCRAPIVVVVTDGFTQVNAKLSDSVVRMLESEIEDKINFETKGDVVLLRDFIVASTPYGPKDEHILLEIQEIVYRYHLRKSLGPTPPILERREASHLLSEIIEIRRRQYDVPDSHAEQDSTGANVVAGVSKRGKQQSSKKSHRPLSQSPMSQLHSSPPAFTSQSYGTKNAIATQLPISRKRKAPTLTEDGLEILQGNNLAIPHGPGFSAPSTGPLFSKLQQADTHTKLLGLIGNPSKRAAVKRSPSPPQKPSVEPEADSVHSSPLAPAIIPDISGGIEQMSTDITDQEPAKTTGQTSVQTQSPFCGFSQNYSHRRLPIAQKDLLEKPDSWLPPQPGKTFPQPNVPIQLLKDWDEQRQVCSVDSDDRSEAEVTEQVLMNVSVSASDPSDSSDDEEYEWSQTQPRSPSPSQKRSGLPPDSSMDNDTHTSPVQASSSLFPDSPQASLAKRDKLPFDSSLGSSVHSTPLQKQTNPIVNRSLGKQQQSPLSCPPRVSENRSTPSVTQSSPLGLQSQHHDRIDGRIERSSLFQVKTRHVPGDARPSSRPATSESIVKATQLQEDDDMDMEMSVPRSLEGPGPRSLKHDSRTAHEKTNPELALKPSVKRKTSLNPSCVAHRMERTQYFKPKHRQHWLKTKYTYDPSAKSFSFAKILAEYKRKHPRESEIRLPEFAEAIQTAFPELYPVGWEVAVGGLTAIDAKSSSEAAGRMTSTATKAPNVGDSPMDDDVVMSNTNDTTADAAANLRGIPAKPGRGVVVDFTDDGDGLKRSSPATSDRLQTTSSGTTFSHRRRSTSAFVGYANPVATDKDVEMLPIPTHVLNTYEYRDIPRPSETAGQTEDRVSKMEFLKYVEKEVGPEKSAEASRLAQEKKRSSRFGEFAQAMKDVQPGGAFAGGGGNAPRGRGSRRLDVMDWDL